ncbi:MAG: hypothetical protein HOJ79_01375 [Nitrospina sp.]|jgi:hypothetical protein|nr:hypothetical protein [Nitrospina sp.]
MTKPAKKKNNDPPKQEKSSKKIKKVKKVSGGKKLPEGQQELARIWNEDLCE